VLRPLLCSSLLVLCLAPTLMAQDRDGTFEAHASRSERGALAAKMHTAHVPFLRAARDWPALVEMLASSDSREPRDRSVEEASAALPSTEVAAFPHAAALPAKRVPNPVPVGWNPPPPRVPNVAAVSLRLVSPEPVVLSLAGFMILACAFLAKRRI
jgi:hypothetical protein